MGAGGLPEHSHDMRHSSSGLDVDACPVFERDRGVPVGSDVDVLAEEVVGGRLELARRVQPGEGGPVGGRSARSR